MKLLFKNSRKFSVISQIKDALDPKLAESVSKATLSLKLNPSPFETKTISSFSPREIQTTVLSNGVKVVTESTSLPTTVNFGVYLNVGTRDETKATSGALHSIKTTYYKSNFNSNETINYGMVQMSGGKYDMVYDREGCIFKASCLGHDVVDIFSMVSDCVLEPRTFVTANAAIEKLGHSHKLEMAKGGHNLKTDKILSSLYGQSGLGMPYLGEEKNILNLDAYTLQRFQIENIKSEEIVVVGLGIENHGEFVELVESQFGALRKSTSEAKREKSYFTEVDIKNNQTSTYNLEGHLIFESNSWNSKDLLTNFLLKELLGSAEVSGISKNSGLLNDQIFENNKAIFSLDAYNMHFTDSGLFGIKIQAESSSYNRVLENVINLLRNINNTSTEELEGAKKRLKIKILESMGKDYKRLEEILKQQAYIGHIDMPKIIGDISQISIESLSKFVNSLLRGKFSNFVEGGNAGQTYSVEKIRNLLN